MTTGHDRHDRPDRMPRVRDTGLGPDDLGTPYLRFERRGPLGYVIVDRPDARNALTSAMYLGVRLALDLVERDPELHGLVITGTGDVFIPGGDMTGRHDDATHDALAYIGIDVLPFQALRRSRVPVVASVNGLCQGGGLIISLCADVTVASERAVFRAPETLRGVVDVNLAAMLPAHVGVAVARDLLMTGRRVTAAEAVQLGLIARVCPHDELESATLQAAKDLLQAAPDTRSAVKEIMNRRYGTIDEITFAGSLSGPEVVEGFTAFAEKREPSWVPEAFREGKRL
jgi:enoyl-CoA hydratase/carnithine racemase